MPDSLTNTQPERHAEFVRLFLGNELRIYGYIRSLIPQRADAENLLQETALVLWEKFDQFQPGTDFARWAIAVARYQVMAFRRKQRRDVLSFGQPFLNIAEEGASTAVDQFDDVQAALDQCLAKLNEADHNLFRRRYLPGAEVSRIAAELGRPLRTVYHALDRIHRTLAECIERYLAQERRA